MKTLVFAPVQQRGLLIFIAMAILVCGFRYAFVLSISPTPKQTLPLPPPAITVLDINAVDSSQLDKLPGIGPVLALRILNYRDKIGGFDSVKELKKIYGLSPTSFQKLLPLLCVDSLDAKSRTKKKSLPSSKKIDLNTASASQLEALPGIGPVLSKRILRYREAIGGFQDFTDLKKVYQLKEEHYQQALPYLELNTPPATVTRKKEIVPVDLNLADAETLIGLPGIGETLAGRIIKYRKLLGFYWKVEQLKAVYGLSGANYKRMHPYLFVSHKNIPAPRPISEANAWKLSCLSKVDRPCAEAIIQWRNLKKANHPEGKLPEIPCLEEEAWKEVKAYYSL